MESDRLSIVHLEVTVPRIVLATSKSRSPAKQPMEAVTALQQSVRSAESKEEAQVRLLPIEAQQQASVEQRKRQQQQQGITGEWSARIIHTLRFRMFHLNLPAQGQPFLFQVLRWGKKSMDEQGQRRETSQEEQGQLHVTDVSAFSVEFRHLRESTEITSSESTETMASTIQPRQDSRVQAGLNRVVIYIDDEGTPSSYSIDGAES